MSDKATAWAWELKLPSTEKLVLVAISRRHHVDTDLCIPSVARVAEETGMTDRAVQKAIKRLIERATMSVHRRRDGKTNLSNAYRLHFGGTFELVRPGPKPVPVPGMGPVAPSAGPQLLLPGTEKGGEPRSSVPPVHQGVVSDVRQGGEPGTPGVVSDVHQGGEPGTPGVVNLRHPVVNDVHPNLFPGNTSPSPLRGSPPNASQDPADRVVRFTAPWRRAAKLLHAARRNRPATASAKAVTVRRPTFRAAVTPATRTPPVQPIGLERFEPSKLLIREWFAEVNHCTLGEVPWGEAEDRALVEMLGTEPRMTMEQLRQRLVYRLAAIEMGEAEPKRKCAGRRVPVRDVMKQLPMYASGPVNVFGDRLSNSV